MFSIRPLTIDNYKAVAQIDKECLGEDSWSEQLYYMELDSSDKIYSVVYYNDIPIAFGGFAQVLDEGHIMNIAVLSAYRKKGVGTLLIDDLVKKGRERGITSFTLEVRDSNVAAIALYEKKGFTLAGIRKKYYGGQEDARIYWLYPEGEEN